METVLRGTATLFAGMAERSARRKRSIAIPISLYARVLKFLLHLAGFGAFIWTGFQVHSVAGGLTIMISCFVFSWLEVGDKSSTNVNRNVDPGLRG